MSATKKDIRKFYEILDVPIHSTLEEIKKAYRLLANKYHPDKCADTDAQEKFIAIREAYETILEFIKKDPDWHSQQVSQKTKAQDAESTDDAKNYRDFLKAFYEEFANKIFSTTESEWADVLHAGNEKKIAIYFHFLDMMEKAQGEDDQEQNALEWLVGAKARLGSEIAADLKRVKRKMITEVLKYISSGNVGNSKLSLPSGLEISANSVGFNLEKILDFDITPTLANHFSESILGRGLDSKFLNKNFGTPGRTAANKTKTTLDEMSDFINITQVMYAKIHDRMITLKLELLNEYLRAKSNEKEFRSRKSREKG